VSEECGGKSRPLVNEFKGDKEIKKGQKRNPFKKRLDRRKKKGWRSPERVRKRDAGKKEKKPTVFAPDGEKKGSGLRWGQRGEGVPSCTFLTKLLEEEKKSATPRREKGFWEIWGGEKLDFSGQKGQDHYRV